MNDDRDFDHDLGDGLDHDPRRDPEKTLRRYSHDPGPRTKGAVMKAFRATFAEEETHDRVPVRGLGRAGKAGARPHFWRRPVPLYLAAVAVVAALGLSFLAGMRTSPRSDRPMVTEPLPAIRGAVTSFDVQWSVAESDLL